MVNAARLRWRCRRGTKELDMVLLRFLDQVFPRLSEADQDSFEALLEAQDPDLSAWLWGGEPAPEQWRNIVVQIQAVARVGPGDSPPGTRSPMAGPF